MAEENGTRPTSLDDIDPTVFIGLGGAGGHVLGRVRRIFQEEFGDEAAIGGASPLQFLLLDTDDFEKLPPEVRDNLPDREQDFLSLSHFNPQRYADRQLKIPDSDMGRWFDRRALRFLEDGIIRDGASRQRMLGRLCLHYSYREVEQRIRAKLQKAADADVHRRATRFRPEPRPLRVFIIASSCGGTGSAAFLDVACMVNRIARDRGTTPSVVGFVFLPFPFIEANTQMDPALEAFYQHNAWAFFEELNHFLLHPERIPEFVLDLDRPLGRPPRPFEYGRDLFRTIYLLNDHVPTVGALDFPQMYAYTARGIFDLFLAPEEGALQSHYSNIKDKLKETDRIHGLVKRFASFGYAEYRLQGGRLAERLADAAVMRVWTNLTGGQDEEAGIDDAVGDLGRHVATEVRKLCDEARGWAPALGTAARATADIHDAQALQALASGRLQIAHASLEQRLQELPDTRHLQTVLTTGLCAVLNARLEWPCLGVRHELAALAKFQVGLRRQAAALRTTDKQVPLTVDADVAKAQEDVSAKAGRVGKRRWPWRADKAIPRHEFAEELERFFGKLREGAHQRQEAELKLRLASALEEIARDGGWLSERMQALGALSDPLQRIDTDAERQPAWDSIPTIREFPPREELETEARTRFDRTWNDVYPVVEQAQRECWKRYLGSPEEHVQDGARRLRASLQELWCREILKRPELSSTRELQNPLESGGAPGAGEHLRALLPMSHPSCPVQRTGLHPADTVSQIPSVIWPWPYTDGERGRILRCLGLPGEASVNRPGRRRRVSVLQAWYGFSSRALEGMETLRRSYLDRHRASSLPHIHAEWNDRGVACAAGGSVHLSDDDVLLAARALALSHRPDTAPKRQVELPGVRIVRDERDSTPFYLVMYDHAGGQTRLRWRDLRPVEGHRRTWEVVYQGRATSDACAHTEDGVFAPAGLDLEQDLSVYLSSEVRARHAQFIAGLDTVERDGHADSEPYLRAYREYLDHLDRLIHHEEAQGRERHLPVLHRLSDALHRHVRGLTLHESRPL